MSTGGTGGSADAGQAAKDSGTAGPDTGAPAVGRDGGGGDGATSGGGVLACWPDPKVIKICHQLENACENCGPRKGVACRNGAPAQICNCFDLIEKAYAGMATDADCEKYAAANNCTVDNVATTGNICGSLNCELPACKCATGDCAAESNRGKTCAADQSWGDSSACQKWAAKCPCN